MNFKCVALLFTLILTGCVHSARDPSLYDELGGESGVARIVDAIVAKVHQDVRIQELFADTDDVYFKARLNEQICRLSGGGCEYTGLSMEEAHSGMGITEAQFNYFVDDCRQAMTAAGVSIAAQNRLLALLAPMRGQVLYQ